LKKRHLSVSICCDVAVAMETMGISWSGLPRT
jgi:hypothetical protein